MRRSNEHPAIRPGMIGAVRLRPSRLAPALLVTAFAACTSAEPPKVDENAFPANYRKDIVNHVMTTKAYDPTNIRDAAIAEPALKPVPGNIMRYAVCVRFNARNDVRVYTGLTERIVYFYGGSINQFQEATPGQCAGAVYQPFPELEKICLAEKCV